mmetsp:Transcript_134369/g.287424  ORF Transcript_134369/g.287424 Transcript_134369/m.287424 type:complete len:81 (-) Transcript_134369:278-520(-)
MGSGASAGVSEGVKSMSDEELKGMLAKIGLDARLKLKACLEPLDRVATVNLLFKELDDDGSGFVNLEEFKQLGDKDAKEG